MTETALDRLLEAEARIERELGEARREAAARVERARARAAELLRERDDAFAEDEAEVRARIEEEQRRIRERIQEEADRRVRAWEELGSGRDELARAVAGEIVRRQGEPLGGRWE